MINTEIDKVLFDEYDDIQVRCASSITYNLKMKRWELYNYSNQVLQFKDPINFTNKLLCAAFEIEPRKEKLEKALEAWKKVMESD